MSKLDSDDEESWGGLGKLRERIWFCVNKAMVIKNFGVKLSALGIDRFVVAILGCPANLPISEWRGSHDL